MKIKTASSKRTSVEDDRKYSFDGGFRNGGCERNINMRVRLFVNVRRVKGKAEQRETRGDRSFFSSFDPIIWLAGSLLM